MERLRTCGAEIWSYIVGFFCWFTPEHCDMLSDFLGLCSNIIGLSIGIPTLIFITIPNIKKSKRFKNFFVKSKD